MYGLYAISSGSQGISWAVAVEERRCTYSEIVETGLSLLSAMRSLPSMFTVTESIFGVRGLDGIVVETDDARTRYEVFSTSAV